MAYLIDTNVLLRSADPDHPMYNDATNAVSILRNQGETLCIVPQNLIEFWNVYTKTAVSLTVQLPHETIVFFYCFV